MRTLLCDYPCDLPARCAGDQSQRSGIVSACFGHTLMQSKTTSAPLGVCSERMRALLRRISPFSSNPFCVVALSGGCGVTSGRFLIMVLQISQVLLPYMTCTNTFATDKQVLTDGGGAKMQVVNR